MFKEAALEAICAPGLPEGRAARSARTGQRRRTSTSSARGIDPLAAAGKLGALLAQFPPSFKDDAGRRATISRSCCARSATTRRRGASSPELERRLRRHAGAAERIQRRLGADRRAEVPLLDPAELPAERAAASTTCGFTGGTPRSGGGTKSGGPLRLPLLGGRAARSSRTRPDAARRAREEVVSLHEQPLLREIGRERRDDQAQLGEPIEGEYPPELVERYPELRGLVTPIADQRPVTSRYSLDDIADPRSSRRRRPSPAMTWPKTVYWPSQIGCGPPA